jgi:adenylate kinase family enzyme
VTGGPGSGKSTFARKLGAAAGLTVYHLDEMALDLEASFPPGEAFTSLAAKLPAIAAEPAWVSDGAYMGWAAPLFDAADAVVWMDVPWRVASYRILTRHLKAELRRNNRFPGWRRLWTFWRWCAGYYQNTNPHRLNAYGVPHTRALAIELLAGYDAKLVACRTNADIDALIQRVPRPGQKLA